MLDPVTAGSIRRFGVSVSLAATLLVLALIVLGDLIFARYLSPTSAWILQLTLAIVGIVAFTWVMFHLFDNIQRRLIAQNEELAALHTAGLAVNHDLKLDIVLQRVVDEARRITRTRYSALMTNGQTTSSQLFITSGIDNDTQQLIGEGPRGIGVLGLALNEKSTFRIEEIGAHPASVGFPKHHPPMHTLLTVPIGAGDDVFGQLYLSDKVDGRPFDEFDQQTVERFAALAALALKNAHQLGQIEALAIVAERNRVAREMHDHVAQVLGYVHTKVQATTERLRSGDGPAAIADLEDIRTVASEAFDDVRDQIAGLRTPAIDESLEDALAAYLAYWSPRAGIPASLDFERVTMELPATVRLQVLRIVQEALTNIDKHADASCAMITAWHCGNRFAVDVEDDGSGFDKQTQPAESTPSFGLAMMRERARSIGGDIEIGRRDGGGTRLRIRVPVTIPADRTGAA